MTIALNRSIIFLMDTNPKSTLREIVESREAALAKGATHEEWAKDLYYTGLATLTKLATR